MRSIPAALQAKLEAGTANLCWCFKLVLADGTVMGFTDHDRALTVGGVVHDPQTGLSASEIKASIGLSVDNLEVFGALSSSRIKDADIQAGRYDDAAVTILRVDWEDPTSWVVIQSGNLGEVRRGRTAFEAEVRGLAHRLNQPVGQQYLATCGAALGDQRCSIDLDDPAHAGSGAVTALPGERVFTASGLGSFADAVFTFGVLTFTSGANAGRAFDVRSHTVLAGVVTIELWDLPPDAIAVADAFTVKAGCDKLLSTCRDRFSNLANFRGYGVLMPGDDAVMSVAKTGRANAGGSRLGNGGAEGVYFDP